MAELLTKLYPKPDTQVELFSDAEPTPIDSHHGVTHLNSSFTVLNHMIIPDNLIYGRILPIISRGMDISLESVVDIKIMIVEL